MREISFFDLNIVSNKFGQDISVEFEESGCEDNEKGCLEFSINKNVNLQPSLFAVALSTLCGRNYGEIKFEFPVSTRKLKEIERFTLANVTSIDAEEDLSGYKSFFKESLVLNFSGGFDSLSSLFLMPEDTKLCSMDFGGRFGRERSFYERFDPFIVSSNIIDTGLRKNSWSFMGISSILSSEFYDTKYYSFGSILEASENNFGPKPAAAEDIGFPPFAACNMRNVPYVLGLSEIGTAIIINKNRPDLVDESLGSLASEGELKKVRKNLILSLVRGQEVTYPNSPPFEYGRFFADDFLFYFFAKKMGQDVARFYKNFPPDALDQIRDLDLSFYEKINPYFYKNMPHSLKFDFQRKMMSNNLEYYLETDWKSFRRVSELLVSNKI